MSNLSGGCNVICPTFEHATVLDCGTNTGGYVSCMNIYADPCVTCTGTCYWEWNASDGVWEPSQNDENTCDPDSSDCGCEDPPPDWEDGDPLTTTTPCSVYNGPPEPDPCPTCSVCSGNLTITSAAYDAFNVGKGSTWTMVADSAVRTGDCEWRISIVWSEIGQTDLSGYADVTYDGTSWTVASTPSQTSEAGDFTYTSGVPNDCDGTFDLTESDSRLTTSHPAGAAEMATTSAPCP